MDIQPIIESANDSCMDTRKLAESYSQKIKLLNLVGEALNSLLCSVEPDIEEVNNESQQSRIVNALDIRSLISCSDIHHSDYKKLAEIYSKKSNLLKLVCEVLNNTSYSVEQKIECIKDVYCSFGKYVKRGSYDDVNAIIHALIARNCHDEILGGKGISRELQKHGIKDRLDFSFIPYNKTEIIGDFLYKSGAWSSIETKFSYYGWSGVYLMCSDSEVLYIGISDGGVRQRIQSHSKKAFSKQCTFVAIAPVEFKRRIKLENLEGKLIRHYMPKHNTAKKPKLKPKQNEL